MDAVEFREYCLGKPNTTEGMPFGETVLVFKVAGKMFALMSLDELPATANLKCDPDVALDLRDRYEQVRPGYHMNKKHWNTVEIDSGIPDAELRRMIDHSYDLVVQSAPRENRGRKQISGERTRLRVPVSAPSPKHSVGKSAMARAPSPAREGACAPQTKAKRPRVVARRRSAIARHRVRC